MAFATGPYTYVWADALTMKVREGGRSPEQSPRITTKAAEAS